MNGNVLIMKVRGIMKRKIRLLSGAMALLMACTALCSCSAEKQDES